MALKSGAKRPSSKQRTTKKLVKEQKPANGELRLKPISEKQTKVQILKYISESTGLTIRQVKEVFLITSHLAKSHLMKKGSGEFAPPELGLKIVRKTKPATKKRQGRNPLTGESITIPAKPKRETIRVRPLKSLKSIIE